jgi:hypothetical protein
MVTPFDLQSRIEEARVNKKPEARKVTSISKKKVYNFNKVDKTAKKITSSVAKSFSQNRVSPAQLLAFRKAKAARLQAEQYQSKASVEASGYDNKFERMLAAEKFKLDEEERLRRFHETPKDILIRRAALHDLKLQRDREMMQRHNIFDVHKMQPKMNLNLLGVDPICNLARTKPMWDRNNFDNNVFQDTGRPTILDTPNRFAVTPQSKQDNILNAERLNFGKVDTTRRPRRFIQSRPEDTF